LVAVSTVVVRLFARFASTADLTERQGSRILDQIRGVAAEWPTFANEAGVDPTKASKVARNLRITTLG